MSSDAMNNPDEDEDEEEEEEEGEEREEKVDRRGFHAKEQERGTSGRGTDGSFIASSAKEEAWEVRQKKKHCHAQKIVCILCFRKVPNMRNLTAADKNTIVESGILRELLEDKYAWLPTVACMTCKRDLSKWTKQLASGLKDW